MSGPGRFRAEVERAREEVREQLRAITEMWGPADDDRESSEPFCASCGIPHPLPLHYDGGPKGGNLDPSPADVMRATGLYSEEEIAGLERDRAEYQRLHVGTEGPIVNDLTEFLLARYAEIEATVRESLAADGWLTAPDHLPTDGLRAYMLADLEAKRRIVEEHEMTTIRPDRKEGYWWDAYCRRCTMDGEYADITREPHEEPCVTLRALAAVFADHPDCRKEWKS